MIINPFPMLGWNSVYKGEINHVAMAVDITTAGGHKTSNLHYRVAPDGLQWHDVPIRGDLAAYTKSSGGPGAFEPKGILRFGSAWYVFGGIWTSATVNQGGVFRSEDGRTWNRVTISYDTVTPTAGFGHYEYGSASASHIVLLKPMGGIAYSSDGETWAGRSDVVGWSSASGPALAARGIAATSGGVTVIGTVAEGGAYRFKTADTPAGTFTDRGGFLGIKNITAVVKGNIVLALSIYNPSLGAQRSAYAPANNLATWADAGLTATTSASAAFFVLDHWYAGSGDDWLVSEGASGTPGVGGWTPVAVPWNDEAVTVGYERNGRAFVHFGNGQIAWSDDGEAFSVVSSANLAAKPYLACAA